MTVQINEELKAYIDPLTPDEYAALEQSLLAEGCRDALVLWGDVLVDGHNRYEICRKHGIEFRTVQNPSFRSMEDVHLWMIDNHLGRRSVSDYQRGVLALRKKTILEARDASVATADPADAAQAAPVASDVPDRPATEGAKSSIPAHTMALTRAALARAARLSSNTLGQIEQIHTAAAPELVEAVKRGEVSINAAAAVSTLPQAAQVAAVVAGKQELRELARSVREARPVKPRKKKEEEIAEEDDGTPPWDTTADPSEELTRLSRELKAMTAERDALKKKVAHLTIALAEARASK
jgi:transposase-like protein